MACCAIIAAIFGLVLAAKARIIAVVRKGSAPQDPRAWKPDEEPPHDNHPQA